MNVIPLFREEPRREIEKVNIEIPADWWYSSYSSSIMDTSKNIFHFSKTNKQLTNPSLPTPGWNLRSGDYRVKESNIDSRDYVYYRDLKLKIAKYSLYLVMVVTIFIIVEISTLLSKL